MKRVLLWIARLLSNMLYFCIFVYFMYKVGELFGYVVL